MLIDNSQKYQAKKPEEFFREIERSIKHHGESISLIVYEQLEGLRDRFRETGKSKLVRQVNNLFARHAKFSFGNKCGHDPKNPRLDIPLVKRFGTGGLPIILRSIQRAVKQSYYEARYLPDLKKHEYFRVRRTERLEALSQVGQVLALHLNLTTFEIQVRSSDKQTLLPITVKYIQQETGLTASRVKRALSHFEESGYLRIEKEMGEHASPVMEITWRFIEDTIGRKKFEPHRLKAIEHQHAKLVEKDSYRMINDEQHRQEQERKNRRRTLFKQSQQDRLPAAKEAQAQSELIDQEFKRLDVLIKQQLEPPS